MKPRSIAMQLMLFFAMAALCCAAENPNMGVWKLNEGKSKFPAGAAKNSNVVYSEASGGQVKVTTDGTDADGKPTHTDWTGKFDGKDYPVSGSPTADTRAYKKVNDNTLQLTEKKGGKITSTGRIVVSPDGKVRTLTVNRMSSDGKTMQYTAVYDKQ